MNKLKVLQVNKLYYPEIGGIEKVVQQVAEELKEKVDMEVLVCKRKGKGYSETINGIKVTRSGSFGIYFSMPVSISFLVRLKIMSRNKDVILFHMPFPLGDLAGILSGYKGKIIVWWHSDIVRQKYLLKLYEPLMMKFLKRADKIVVATEGHIKNSKYLKEFKDKCVIIPYGVDNSIIQDSYNYTARENNSKEITFLFVGRLVYYKGCEILVRAFAKLNIGRLIIAGNGPLKSKLIEIINELNVSDKVVFISDLSDDKIKELYKECDVFVLPSVEITEAFGIVQIEAMAYGKPVINTSLKSGVPYVGINGETCITVKPKDVGSLYTAMKWIVENPQKRNIMGKKAKELVQEKYLLKNMAERLYSIFI